MRLKFLKETAIIIILAAVSAIVFNGFSENGLNIIYKPLEIPPGNTVNLSELKQLLKKANVVLIDARNNAEFIQGHIPGARNLPLQSPRNAKIEFLSKFPKEIVFVLYCINVECSQSEHLAKQLNLLGFSNTHVFNGGWQAWQKAGQNAQ